MSSGDDQLDNSTTALLQPDQSEADQVEQNHNQVLASSLTDGDQRQQQQQQQPSTATDSVNTSSQPPAEEQSQTTDPSQKDEDSGSSSKSQQQKVGNSETESQQTGDVQPETQPVELTIENESDPQLQNKNSSEKSDDLSPGNASASEKPPSNDQDGADCNLKEDQIEEDNFAAAEEIDTLVTKTKQKKASRSARIRAAFHSVPTAKLRKFRMATSIEDIGSLRLWKGIVAEFLGTLLLTMVGCGSCINLRGETNVTSPVVQIALCFGLSVATIVWAIGHVSGGHINPAVTVAMLATRKISLAKAAFFIIFQLIGAVVGAGLLYGMTPSNYHGSLGATLVSEHLNVGQAVGVEIFITFILVFVVFASVDGKRRDLNGSTPLTIGLSVTMCHLFAIDFTGSSMNTARSFGPAVVIGKWSDHWVYWLGPILGGVLAGLLYENLFAVNASLEKAKACLLSSDYDDEKYQAQKMKIRILEEDPDETKEDLPLSEKNSHGDGDPLNV